MDSGARASRERGACGARCVRAQGRGRGGRLRLRDHPDERSAGVREARAERGRRAIEVSVDKVDERLVHWAHRLRWLTAAERRLEVNRRADDARLVKVERPAVHCVREGARGVGERRRVGGDRRTVARRAVHRVELLGRRQRIWVGNASGEHFERAADGQGRDEVALGWAGAAAGVARRAAERGAQIEERGLRRRVGEVEVGVPADHHPVGQLIIVPSLAAKLDAHLIRAVWLPLIEPGRSLVRADHAEHEVAGDVLVLRAGEEVLAQLIPQPGEHVVGREPHLLRRAGGDDHAMISTRSRRDLGAISTRSRRSSSIGGSRSSARHVSTRPAVPVISTHASATSLMPRTR